MITMVTRLIPPYHNIILTFMLKNVTISRKYKEEEERKHEEYEP